MPLFKTPTARANVAPVAIQATRGNFPYAMAFIQPEPLLQINMQDVQERGTRWLGNVDALVARERERMRLEFAKEDAKIPAVTPSTGPIPPDVLPPSITIQLPAGGGGSGGGSMTDARQFITINGGFSGGCK